MAYTKWFSDWKDASSATGGGDTSTPLDQAALDHIETGIFDAAATADSASTAAAAAQSSADGKAGLGLILALGG